MYNSLLVVDHSFIMFSLIIHSLPRSTLFPYTTLFRSLRLRTVLALRNVIGRFTSHKQDNSEGQAASLDRKSTRLNSSHANISYAVFCLKIKTKPSHAPWTRTRTGCQRQVRQEEARSAA